MFRIAVDNRRGLTLMEVLVAIFILAIGVIAIISLFPVGVQTIRQSVFDTRSTIIAINAESTIELFDWINDPYLMNPPARTPSNPLSLGPMPDPGAQNEPLPLHPSDPSFPAAGPSTSAYAKLVNSLGASIVAFPTTGDSGEGFPVYVDPVLANNMAFQDDSSTVDLVDLAYKQIGIRSNLAPPMSTFTLVDFTTNPLPYFDLPIHTVSDVQTVPVGVDIGGSRTVVDRRTAFMRQWLYSDVDLEFDSQNPVLPRNPARSPGISVQPWEYYQSILPPVDSAAVPSGNSKVQAHSTAIRSLEFHWAFAINGRRINNGIPADSWESLSILVFSRRNFADPYRLTRGCFFNKSNLATISWPVNPTGRETSRPTIRRGTWLMEYAVTGVARTDTSAANKPIHRRQIKFHRVAALDDPVLDAGGGNWIQSVTLEQAVDDAMFPEHVDGALRQRPDRFSAPANTSSGATPLGPVYFGTTAVTATPGIATPTLSTHVWVPVIIWDGLIDVLKIKD
ncbi:MAG: prepilin-type N-terminal cleavage/methylation domain-containing protein [Planctomycetota bacterium]